MSVKPTNAVPLPSFLLPSAKRRQLIMTDLPRLLAVKDDPETGEPRIKTEFEFLAHPIPGRMRAVASNQSSREKEESSINYILEVQEKGSKVFVLQTVSRKVPCRMLMPGDSSFHVHIGHRRHSCRMDTHPLSGGVNFCCTIPPSPYLH